jgi:NitT/TauT family transport system permease protein
LRRSEPRTLEWQATSASADPTAVPSRRASRWSDSRWLTGLRHARPRRRWLVTLAQVVIVGGFLLIWELGSGDPRRGALIDQLFFSKPSLIGARILKWLLDGTILNNAGVTLEEAMLGFVIGALTGILLGFVLGLTMIGRTVFAPLVFVAYAVPRYGFAPMFILWFGLGIQSKVALVTLVTFFYVFFNTFEGTREVDPDLIGVLRIMRASSWQILRTVTLPAALVWVALGMKISIPHAFGTAIFGELLAGYVGLGALMRNSGSTLDATGLFGATVATAVLAIAVNALVARVVDFWLRWRAAG